jgi:hypothetical protein
LLLLFLLQLALKLLISFRSYFLLFGVLLLGIKLTSLLHLFGTVEDYPTTVLSSQLVKERLLTLALLLLILKSPLVALNTRFKDNIGGS